MNECEMLNENCSYEFQLEMEYYAADERRLIVLLKRIDVRYLVRDVSRLVEGAETLYRNKIFSNIYSLSITSQLTQCKNSYSRTY